jgi:hypothetical protein
MKRWQKVVALSSGLALVMSSLFTSTLAWFVAANKATLDSGLGYTASSYFAGGDGSASDPYIINEPIHLYNLAWLQYLGYFNQADNGAYMQVYFALGGDVDMSNAFGNDWTLPPIGTSVHPFIGNFDGGNHTISNLMVDNEIGDGHITRKPTIVSSLSDVNIVGTFGVVGDYQNVLGSTDTWSTAVNVVKDVYLDNVTVTSQLDSTLIGVAAGYVNAAFTGVGVAESHLVVNSGSVPLDSVNLTSNLSDYATVGYATDSFEATRNVSTTDVKAPTTSACTYSAQESGTVNSWGGSIDMESMFDRLTTFQSSATTLDLSSAVKTETITVDVGGNSSTAYTYYGGSFKEYYDSNTPLKGSYSFSIRSDSTTSYIYLYGHKALTKTITTNTLATYKIYTGSNYLTVSGTSLANTTSSSSAANWTFMNYSGSGYIFTLIGGTRYYLRYSTSLSLSTSASTSWTYSGGKIYSGSRYLRYYNGWTTTTTSSSASTISTTVVSAAVSSSSTALNGIETRDTYFPLNVDGSSLPTTSNTGYVISGSNYENTDYPYRSGDIRVSQYPMSDISTGLSGATTYSDTKLEVLTKTSKSGGNFVRIYDDYNKNNSLSSSSALYGYAKSSSTTTPSALGLEKYTKSRASVSTLLTGSSSIYGLHFMDAVISSSNLATAASVRVKRADSDSTDFSNYEMPRNSIDFNLRKKGYINFFSGSYFTDNDSFFSLHQITRNSNSQSISSIKEISYIFQSSITSDPYIYQYSDGTYSASLTSNYSATPVFDTTWIKSPTMVSNAVYYFEIPVNDGEYALGSVSGHLGAYLLYLDISANAQLVDRTIVTDYVVITTRCYQYPLGVSIVVAPTESSKETVDSLFSAAVAIENGYVGEFTFTKTGATITFTSDNDNFSPGFKGDGIVLARNGSTDPPSVTAISTITSEIKRLTYIDYNTATEETTQTIITNTDGTMAYSSIANDGTVTIPTEYYDNDGNLVVIGSGSIAIDVSSNTVSILTYWFSYTAATSTIAMSIRFGYSATSSILQDGTTFIGADIISYTVVLSSATDDINVSVTAADGAYAILINGIIVTMGSLIAVGAASSS